MSHRFLSDEITFDSIRDIKIYQPKSGYRFSVDSLLLFNFVNLKRIKSIADLGSGIGIIGLLLAKRYEISKVFLFEIQDKLAELASRNIEINGLKDRVSVFNIDMQEIPSFYSGLYSSFDVVVSNPPFRKIRSGRINPYEEKALARHEIAIDLSRLVDVVDFLLKPKGRVFLIYHPSRLTEVITELRKNGIEAKRLQFVHSGIYSEAKMVLIEGVKSGKTGLKVERPFFIYDESGEYTKEMKSVYETQDPELRKKI